VKGILHANQTFQGGEMLIFFQISLSAELTKHIYLSKETHLLEYQEHLAHCFPVRIELVFERNAFLHHRCFTVDIGSVGSKEAYSAELKKHMYLSKETNLC
jgi:hypothetical protein